MYNTSGLLSVPSVASVDGGATPRTPEIVNSLMAMTNPFDLLRGPRVAASPPSDTTSTSSNSSSTSPPSVQHTCSQLIKEGLKLTIQTKRRNNHNPPLSGSEESHSKHLGRSEELTPEDEERRRRRRERNKIAATKCRLKKRERTVNLVQESEILETQNHDLKSQIQDLENERKRLVDMLSVHRPSCSKLPFANAPEYQNPGYNAQCNNTIASTASVYSAPYCKLEVNCETSYHKSESTYHRIETVEEIGFNRPLTYHTFDSGVKEPMLPFCRSDLGDPGYMRSEPYGTMTLEGPQTYLRSPRHYQRPSALGVASCPDYESGKDILDSPNIAPTNYHHFDEDADNYSAGFPSGSCIT